MCDFPSWYETKDGPVFLTDQEVEDHHLDKVSEYDIVGHSAIRRVFPLQPGWVEREGFSCPKEIVAAIRNGKMNRMMRSGGYAAVFLSDDGKRHRTDGPAVELVDGTKEWWVDGKLHRLDGPAIEWADGTNQWWVDGKRHRIDGPAIEWADGAKEWWVDGKRHRTDGPAIERADGTKEWWVDGKRHRLDGPAIEGADGTKQWWVDGKYVKGGNG